MGRGEGITESVGDGRPVDPGPPDDLVHLKIIVPPFDWLLARVIYGPSSQDHGTRVPTDERWVLYADYASHVVAGAKGTTLQYDDDDDDDDDDERKIMAYGCCRIPLSPHT